MTEHVIDRYGMVWRAIRDGRLATRADESGGTTVTMGWLERTSGPLIPFDPVAYRAAYAQPATAEFTLRRMCQAAAPLVVNGGAFAGCTEDEGHQPPHQFTVSWT